MSFRNSRHSQVEFPELGVPWGTLLRERLQACALHFGGPPRGEACGARERGVAKKFLRLREVRLLIK